MSQTHRRRGCPDAFVQRMEVLAEELEEAIGEAIELGDLAQAADLWAASSAVWSAAADLSDSRERP